MGDAERLLQTIHGVPDLAAVLERAESLGLDDWYLGAGALSQTVWNLQHGFAPLHAVKDYDLIYFDASDLSWEAEDDQIRRASAVFADLSRPVEIRNQARVHLWYAGHFGYEIPPYRSSQDAIRTWPTTSNAVGVTRRDGDWSVFAPFGLDDLFSMTVRPNKVRITQEIYERKVARWRAVWPRLRIIRWDDEQPA